MSSSPEDHKRPKARSRRTGAQDDDDPGVPHLTDRITQKEVTYRIKKVREKLSDVQAHISALEALRDEMRKAKAKTVGELPTREKHRDALSLLRIFW